MGALDCGVYRFGKSATYHKKAIYKFVKKVAKKPAAAKKQIFVEKKVGGAKNGGTRMVRAKKLANDYPTVAPAAKGTSVAFFSKQKRNVRASLSAGTVAIVLAGVHKGKRVVVLKQLETGLLLVTGPFKLNGTPLRRVNQRFLLATSTKVDVSGVKVPESINDKYFARIKAEKSAKKDGDIFDAKKEGYKPSEQRKKDQAEIDKLVLAAVKAHKEGKALKQYLKAPFALSKGQFPHKMSF